MGPPSITGALSLLLLLHGGYSGPIVTQETSRCINSLPVGKTYIYQFNGLNKIENEDVNQEVSFSSEVVVSVPRPCILNVRMRNVVSPHKKFVEVLEKNPIEVHMDNGVVSFIKHDRADPAWAMNIKRAAVSILQAPYDARDASAETTERDILGDCETSYTARPTEGDEAGITKTKKLLTCQGRFQSEHAVFFTPYTAPTSDIRTIPMAHGTYICHQSLDKETGVVRKAECQQKEDLYIDQQSSTKPGIISKILAESSISLLREEDGAEAIESGEFRESTLKFDHTHAIEHSGESLVLAVNRYCDALRDDVRPETGKLFRDMIISMRSTSFEKILGVYQMLDAKKCDTDRLKTAFLDVLSKAGTSGAVQMMAKFIENGEKPEHHEEWLASLAYIMAPTEEMIEAFVPVVMTTETPKKVFLPVSAMANTFCKLHGADCERVPAIQKLLNSFIHKLGSGCSNDRVFVVAALKAIGNLGVIGENSDAIMACNDQPAVDMRLYTVGAFRKVCKPEITNKMLDIYSNMEDDSEVRIAAYLNSMRCADFDDLARIVKVYENEKTNQVGSFVFSHMQNIHESVSPMKVAMKQLIASFPISAKFSKDPTMFSQHYEWSKYYDFANLGGAADASLVFSPKSFLPRSGVLNLTVDLFSQSINILEIGGRVEGLENILEQLMGPRTQVGESITQALVRSKRATSEDTDVTQFDNEVKFEKPEQKMSFYVNLFGNEVDFIEYESIDDLVTQMVSSAFNLMRFNPANFLSEVRMSGQIDIAKNVILMDNRVTGATISGVSLAADMTAVSNVILKASAPVPEPNKDLKVTLEPSAVIQLDAALTLDAGVFRHGARLASTIHSSSVVDVVVVKTDNEFKFRFNTPRDKIELLNARSEVFTIHGDYETRVEPETTRPLDGCTVQLPNLIGMKACLVGSVPKPWYIARRGFVKPFDIALTIEKTDMTMEGIEIRAMKTSNKFSLVFDTPGSSVDRKRELSIEKLSGTHDGIKAMLRCPRRHRHFEVAIGNYPRRDAHIMYTVEDRQTRQLDEYSLKGTYDDTSMEFEARCPHLSEPAKLKIERAGNVFTADSNYPFEKPLRMRAEINKRDLMWVLDSSLSVKGIDASAKMTFGLVPNLMQGSVNVEYTLEGQRTEKASYDLKIQGSDTEQGYYYNGVSTWTSTCHPDYNVKASFDMLRAGEHSRKHKIQVWWGGQFRDEKKTFRFNFDAKNKGDFGYNKVTTLQVFAQAFSPALEINWEAKYNNKFDMSRTPRITAELYVTSFDETLVKLDFLVDRQAPKTTTRLSLIAPDTRLSFTDNSEEIARRKYKGSTEIEWGLEGKKLNIDYVSEILNNGNHELGLQIRAPGMKPIKHNHLIRIARDIKLQTQTLIDGKEYIVFEMMKEADSLAFNFVGQKIKINYSREVNDKTVDVKLDVKSKVIYTRPIKMVLHKESPGKRTHKLNMDLLWDAEANPDKKLTIVLDTDRENGVRSNIKIDVANLINFAYKGDYAKDFVHGPNRAEFTLSGAKFETRELVVGHTHSKPKGEGYLVYKRGGQALVDAKIGHEFTEARRFYYLIVTGVVNRKFTINRDLASNVLTVEFDRDGKLYQLVVDRKTDLSKGIIDLKVTLKTPHERFASQEFTVKGTIIDGKVDITAHFLAASGRNYHFVITGTRPAPRVADLQIAIKTDNDKMKEGKAHLKYNIPDPHNIDLELTVEADSNKVIDLDVKIAGKSYFDRSGTVKFSSKWTPSYIVTITRSGTSNKFVSDMTITKDGVENYMTSHTEFTHIPGKLGLLFKSHSPRGDLEVEFDQTHLPGDNHRTYKLNIKRNDKELKADAETQHVDGYKVTSVNVCRTPLDSNCISVTVKRNLEFFRGFISDKEINVKIHRKPDVTLELDGQIHLPRDTHKAHVRLFGAINECKLGVEFHCDHTAEHVSQQSLRGYIIERELLATRRREETDKLIDVKYTLALDAKSDEKMEFSYRRDYNDKGYTSHAKLSHPKMRTPIELKSKVSRGEEPNSLIRIESQLEWFKPEETLFFHYERRVNDLIARNRSVHLHIHKQDRTDYNLHITAYRSESLDKPVFAGYYWSYITAKKETRAGHLKAFIGEDLKGYIDFSSPYQDDFKITGEARVLNDDGDKEAEIVHLKNGVETKGKISYNLDKAYMKAVILDDAGNAKRELEVDGGRKERGRFKFVLSSFPDGKKTTDLGVEHTQSSASNFYTRVYAPPEYVQRVAARAKEIAASRVGKYPIEDIKEEFQTRMNAFSFKLRKTFEDMGEYLISKVTHIFVDVQNCLAHLINNTTVGQRLKKYLEAHREQILAIIERLRAVLRKYSPKLDAYIGEQLEKYMPKRTRRSVLEQRDDFVIYLIERVDRFVNWIQDTYIVRAMNAVYEGTCDAINSVGRCITDLYTKAEKAFLNLPDVKQIADTWAELYDSSSFGHMLPREALEKYIIRPRIESWKARKPMFEIDRKAGRFVADVDMPVDVSKIYNYWVKGASACSEDTDRESTLDLIQNSLGRLYDGHASIIDGKHFVTFDGKHFSAAGECSYLLARDFADGNFTVIMKPGDELTYVVQLDKKFFEINTVQETVTLNGSPIELPYLAGKVAVARVFDKIVIRDPATLQFTVYLSRKTASLDLRMWYFGKTAGLLGNYNREPYDDFTTPSGQIVSGEQTFLKSWETAQGCRSKTMLFRERSEDVEAVELCQKMFKSEKSPMSFGFMLRDAEQYHDLCLRVAHVAARKVDSVCRVAHAYMLDIERFGDLPGYLGVRLPDECLTCQLPSTNGKMKEAEVGSSALVDLEFGDYADVVFVVQEARCNSLIAGYLPAFLKSLEKELGQRDIRDNRYGIVSFGRSKYKNAPFARTSNGKLFFPARNVSNALRGMNFQASHKADIYLAIRQALVEYRFRPTATKIIIAFTCHSCDVMDRSAPDSVDLQKALVERGIILHVVSRTEIRVRGSASKKGLDLLGMDGATAFTVRDASRRGITGQPELRVQLRSPKDRCATVAQESRGSYFTTPRRAEVRAWRTLLARRVAQDVVTEERCTICECALMENWNTVTRCRPCKPYRADNSGAYSEYEDLE